MPTAHGEGWLHLYQCDESPGEHMALVFGEPAGKDKVLVRIHSECFTGDVFGSMRCDCGEQLQAALNRIEERATGVVLYLRQEGRGIGLAAKLAAYNLQDDGHDTVSANLALGHVADARDYSVAADILRDLGIESISLMTNNPAKVEAMKEHGIDCTRSMLATTANQHNAHYLRTKQVRMGHLLDVPDAALQSTPQSSDERIGRDDADELKSILDHCTTPPPRVPTARPRVTVSYAQSINGTIASIERRALSLSGQESLRLTHSLRARHDAIVVGIETLLADDPLLTVRYAKGRNPRVVIADGGLRTPVSARVFDHGHKEPWIFTSLDACPMREAALAERGARVMRVGSTQGGQLDLEEILRTLAVLGIRSVMVEGGGKLITSFLHYQLADHLVVTIAPTMVAGLAVVDADNLPAEAPLGIPPMLLSCEHYQTPQYMRLGRDIVISARMPSR